LPVGQQAEVTDAHEAARKQVKQEAAQELIDRQSQQPLLVSMSGVSPAERDVAFRESNQPAAGDGDAQLSILFRGNAASLLTHDESGKTTKTGIVAESFILLLPVSRTVLQNTLSSDTRHIQSLRPGDRLQLFDDPEFTWRR
jgi:hypothetical protein